MIMSNSTESTEQMNAKWWEGFLAKTDGLENPIVIKGILNEHIEEYTIRCLYAVKLICLEKRNPPRFRVWVDREQTTEYNQKMYSNAPEEYQTLEEWAAKIFGGKRFGIIINDVEAFDGVLNRKIANAFKPLFDIIGIPTGGISMGLFIGNYGYTPLGIHHDSPEERIFHLQLGPGNKYMYEWPDKLYQELNGGIVGYQNVDEIIDQAVKHEFAQGDLFYMPQKNFHIGDSPQLSLDLVLGLNNDPQNRVINKIREFRDEHLNSRNNTAIENLYYLPDNKNTNSMLLHLFQPDEDYDNLTQQEYLLELLSDYQKALFSNQGFYTKQFKISTDIAYEDVKGRTIKIIEPFKIFYKNFRYKIKIFCRGHVIVIPDHQAIPSIIDKINSGEAQAINTLIRPLLEEWSDDIGLYLISLIINFQGAEILPRSTIKTDSE